MSITKKEVTENLIHVSKQISKIPSKQQWERYGKYSVKPVVRIFGSWSNALYEIFGVITKPRLPRKISSCVNCNQETKNPLFCSRSCATSHNNRMGKVGRKKIPHFCDICSKEIQSKRKFCSECKMNYIKVNIRTNIKTNNGCIKHISQVTKSEMFSNSPQKYTRIRMHARSIAVKNKMLESCSVCGYSLYVECAHKKSIASFPNDTLITVINDPNNLIGLCRNHHWEFDHHFLSIP